MAKKMRRILVLCMVLVFSISMIATPAMATGLGSARKMEQSGGLAWGVQEDATVIEETDLGAGEFEGRNDKEDNNTTSSSSYYEWYKVYVDGALKAEDQGASGNDGWLIRGVYTYSVSVGADGRSLNWRIGNQSGTVYPNLPAGYTIATFGEGISYSNADVTGTNSQAERFDNAILTIKILTVYNEQGEEVEVPDPTEPPATEPPATEPPATEPPATEPPATEPPATEPPAPVDYEPTVSIVKTAAQTTYKEGETVSWTITVKNTSEYPAYNVVVTDALTGDSWTIAVLAPGAQQSFTATLENAPAGTIKNVAVVSWGDGDEIPDDKEPEEPKASSDEEIVEVKEPTDYAPVVNIVKTATQTTYKEGETVSWTITVKNVSEYPAYNVVVTDALTGDSWTIAVLAPGAEQSFTATLENAPAGIIKNVAVVTWDDGDEIPDDKEPEEPKASSDEEIVEVKEPVNYTPVVSIVKTADKAVYEHGETITWTITVKNVSEYTAYNVVVTDALTGDSWTIAVLAPGAERSFTATTENAESGSVKNVAVASWEDGDEIPDSEEPNEIKNVSDEEIVSVNDPAPENYTPVLSVVKTAEKDTYKEGEAITWTITVKNVSEYPAYNVVIVDELAKGYWTIDVLAPGAEQSFTVTMENVAAGSVKNVVIVSWNDGDEIPDEEEPNEITETRDEEVVTVEELIDYTPILSITKTANKRNYRVGNTVTWTITVKNVSEYTAYNVVVTDDLTGESWSIASLAPGAEVSFTATLKNVKAGTITNVAEVTWEDGDEVDDEKEPEEPKSASDDETVEVKKPYVPVQPMEPDPTNPEQPDPTQPDPTDAPAAQSDEIEIPDEDVPLAAAPKTGDISILWIALSGISAGGMILLGKKREDEE